MVRQYYRPEMDHHVSDRALWTMMNEQMYGAFGANTPDWKTYCLRDLRERFGPGFPRDARTAAGVSPLYDAMHFGCLRFAELLMELGGDLEMRTHAGKSLLMACIDGNKPEAARWLLAQWRRRAGKPLEVLLEGRSAVGYTPLWWCGMDGRTEIAVLLLAHGADHRAVDRNGQNCRSIAAQRRNWPVVALLDEAERAYTVACVRRLGEGEFERAAPAADPVAVAEGREEVVAAVAFFVCQMLPDDLWRVLDDMLWGSVGLG